MAKRSSSRLRRWIVAIVIIDALLILLPPLYWAMAAGNQTLALVYVLGVPTVVALSVPLLDRITQKIEAATPEQDLGVIADGQ